MDNVSQLLVSLCLISEKSIIYCERGDWHFKLVDEMVKDFKRLIFLLSPVLFSLFCNTLTQNGVRNNYKGASDGFFRFAGFG
jgi:hypothetical protein